MPMQMADKLVQIIAKPYELHVKKLRRIIVCPILLRSTVFIEHHRPPEMDGTHTNGFGAQPDALKFARGEAKIELLVTGF